MGVKSRSEITLTYLYALLQVPRKPRTCPPGADVAIPILRQGLNCLEELDIPAPEDTVLRCHHWPHMHNVMLSLGVPRAHRSKGFDFDIFFKNRHDQHFTVLY